MRILQVHNFYQQAGGEDAVLSAEHRLLTEHGHEVAQYTVSNFAVNGMSATSVFMKTIWNGETDRQIRKTISEFEPDVIHAHNTFPLVSPSLYYAASGSDVPVVQTLHNYRLLCLGATFYRGGKVCEDCLGRIPVSGILHRCYRNSLGASAATGALLTIHRAAGTWSEKVNTYIALTEFGKAKFISGGLPAHKIVVKPNFLGEDPGVGEGRGGYALFAGRLSEDKGVLTLLEAWKHLRRRMRLKIAGDGPLRARVENEARQIAGVEVIGHCDRDTVMRLLKRAEFLVCPSSWYEGLPMSVIESFACGTPVVTSLLPSMDGVVDEGVNGRRFVPGRADSLATCIDEIQIDESLGRMRAAARRSFEAKYTPDRNYLLLMDIYRTAMRRGAPIVEEELRAEDEITAQSQTSVRLLPKVLGTRSF